jgi:hypothetical protein
VVLKSVAKQMLLPDDEYLSQMMDQQKQLEK